MNYDLLERTERFAVDVRKFVLKNIDLKSFKSDYEQLVRASGSIGANYSEANDALGKKDFLFRIRIARKEAKEAEFWLKVIKSSYNLEGDIDILLLEVSALRKILSAIIIKTEKPN